MAVAVASTSTVAPAGSVGSVAPTKPTGLAVGDLLVFYGVCSNAGSNGNFQVPAGWTESYNNQGAGNPIVSLQYKVADSSDVAASSFTFNLANSALAGCILFRITGYANADLLNNNAARVNNSAGGTFTNTVTPLTTNQLLLLLVGVGQAESGETVSGYAVATTNPTWTEHIDSNNNSGLAIAAASAYRTSASATGSSTVTLSGSGSAEDTVAVLVAIPEPVNVSVSGATGALTLAGAGGAVTGSANVTGSTGTLTLAGAGGTVDTSLPDWTPQTKHTSTWTNQSKS